jgi:uncharacterized protein
MKNEKKGERNFSWMNPKLEVRDTKKYGKGVFAKEDIKKGETLAVFGGYVVKLDEEPTDSGIQISENLILSSLNYTEQTDYINHSCNPNSGIKGQNFLVSIIKIKKNEQITFDYAMCLYSQTKKADYTIDCLCESKNCRKIVTSNDWKIPDLQKRYNGYFQLFLQEKINKII